MPALAAGREKEHEDPVHPKNIVTLPSRPDRQLDVGRGRMILQNFLLVRVLINHVVLTPWACGVCRKVSAPLGRSLPVWGPETPLPLHRRQPAPL